MLPAAVIEVFRRNPADDRRPSQRAPAGGTPRRWDPGLRRVPHNAGDGTCEVGVSRNRVLPVQIGDGRPI